MTGHSRSEAHALQDAAERVSAWWWLALPMVLFAAIVLFDLAITHSDDNWLYSEGGPIENAQELILVICLVLSIRLLALRKVRAVSWLFCFVASAVAGVCYTLGEEISWGQQVFRWTTPEAWQQINDQGETNLHNTSSWFDQKPRFLLELGVIVGGIVVPLVALAHPAIRQWRYALLLPPLICLPTAVLAEVARFSERAVEVGLASRYLLGRASEVQELFFYLFLLLFLVALRSRLVDNAD